MIRRNSSPSFVRRAPDPKPEIGFVRRNQPSQTMVRKTKEEVVDTKMVRKQKSLLEERNGPVPTKFIWCRRNEQYQHVDVCESNCKRCDHCKSLRKYRYSHREED